MSTKARIASENSYTPQKEQKAALVGNILKRVEKVESVDLDDSFPEELEVAEENALPKSRLPRHITVQRMHEIVIEHREHGRRLAWSFLNHWRIRMKQDDVISIVGAALCEAATRFDESKGVSFKTFFFYHLRGMLLKDITRVVQEQKMVLCVAPGAMADPASPDYNLKGGWIPSLIDNNNPEKLLQHRENAALCWEACSKLDELEREVLVRHYIYDESLVDIADGLNYCRCHISRVKSRALAKAQSFVFSVTGKDNQLEKLLAEQKKVVAEANPGSRTGRSKTAARRIGYSGGRGRRRTTELTGASTFVAKVRKLA